MALILTFGPISVAHFNPAVTLADASQGGLPWRDVPGFVVAQLLGAAAATLLFRWLIPSLPGVAEGVVVPHGAEGGERHEGAFSE